MWWKHAESSNVVLPTPQEKYFFMSFFSTVWQRWRGGAGALDLGIMSHVLYHRTATLSITILSIMYSIKAYFKSLSITTFSHCAENRYDGYPNWLIFMLNVIMLNVIMLTVIMLTVIMLTVIMLSVIMLSVIMLTVITITVIMITVIVLTVIMLNIIMLSVIMLSVFMLSAIILSVMVPRTAPIGFQKRVLTHSAMANGRQS
jgi:hypothetical protein